MKQVAVISGKGGTGKTTLAASFAVLGRNQVVIADADVDAPDLHLLLSPQVLQSEEFFGSKIAIMDENKCTECAECERHCRFEAIKDLRIDPLHCEGCGVCAYVCPEEAITLQDERTGDVYTSETKFGPMVHANLYPGSEASGKLVTQVRNLAQRLCLEHDGGLIVIIDGPPGIGCPVIASLAGVDLALIVTEPTLSGLVDMKRVLDLAEHFNIEPLVCINKFDINLKNTQTIREFCRESKIEFVGMIPFDEEVDRALKLGRSVVDIFDGPAAGAIRKVWKIVLRHLGNGKSIESSCQKEAY